MLLHIYYDETTANVVTLFNCSQFRVLNAALLKKDTADLLL